MQSPSQCSWVPQLPSRKLRTAKPVGSLGYSMLWGGVMVCLDLSKLQDKVLCDLYFIS